MLLLIQGSAGFSNMAIWSHVAYPPEDALTVFMADWSPDPKLPASWAFTVMSDERIQVANKKNTDPNVEFAVRNENIGLILCDWSFRPKPLFRLRGL